MSRKLVVFSTNGGGKTIDIDATNLKDLQVELTKNNISFQGMKIVDNKKRTLESPEADISDVTNIFLMPTKTKSGGTDASGFSYSDVKDFIKKAIAADEEGAKAHFNVGKNYTNKTTLELKELIGSYNPKGAKKSAAPIKATVKEAEVSKKETATVKSTAKAIPASTSKAVAKAEKPAINTTKEVAASVNKAVAKIGDSVEDIAIAVEGLKEQGFDVELVDEAIKAILRIKVGKEPGLDEKALKAEYEEIAKNIPGIRA